MPVMRPKCLRSHPALPALSPTHPSRAPAHPPAAPPAAAAGSPGLGSRPQSSLSPPGRGGARAQASDQQCEAAVRACRSRKLEERRATCLVDHQPALTATAPGFCQTGWTQPLIPHPPSPTPTCWMLLNWPLRAACSRPCTAEAGTAPATSRMAPGSTGLPRNRTAL